MISHADLAALCARSYDASATWDFVHEAPGIRLTVQRTDDGDVCVLRGSETIEDWFENFWARPTRLPGPLASLGYVDYGFANDIPAALAAVLPVLGPRVHVTGHSRGAAQGANLAGALALSGLTPASCITFGQPRPGFRELAEFLTHSGMSLTAYANKGDPVPLVPDLLGLYVNAPALTWINVDPDPNDADLLFRCHHIELYQRGVSQT